PVQSRLDLSGAGTDGEGVAVVTPQPGAVPVRCFYRAQALSVAGPGTSPTRGSRRRLGSLSRGAGPLPRRRRAALRGRAIASGARGPARGRGLLSPAAPGAATRPLRQRERRPAQLPRPAPVGFPVSRARPG